MMITRDAHLVAMDAGRGTEFVDFFWIARVADVMRREAFRPVVARAADRAHIGIALVHLDDAAAAPGGAVVMPEQFESVGFLGLARGHSVSPSIRCMSDRSAFPSPASGGGERRGTACVQIESSTRPIAPADGWLALAETRKLPDAGPARIAIGADVRIDQIRPSGRDAGAHG